MRHLDLLIDQDEVCAHWVQEVLDSHNKEHGTEYTRSHITNYFAMETLDPKLKDTTLAHLDKPGLYKSLRPFEGAIDGMRVLHEKGHHVFIVSSVPSGVSFDEKKLWIKDHLPWFKMENFGAWARKDRIYGDVLLDDAPHHIEAFAKTGRIAAVFDSPWNHHMESTRSVDDFDVEEFYRTQYIDLRRGIIRVNGWVDFIKLIEKIEKVG
jgi:5'-nucleotidase